MLKDETSGIKTEPPCHFNILICCTIYYENIYVESTLRQRVKNHELSTLSSF